ncbi:gamma carbonic anhydrase family protein [Amantichitinum ursilacus]|uniref:UDP-3-O-acylglucosamine N-acyltransferase n=1 Tax=Amantichitinum ursilacus TaxID=857265 RepID=A0A0N0XJC7_9NEIS|nr:transferase [Amantichitinum ursilacus]KPC53182.1 UDP-3-O-acylglucosamine N-acyltransferase [Amantichitinum ursilacus]
MTAAANRQPTIHPTAQIAASAVIEGAVEIGAHSVISHGAVLVAEGGTLRIGAHCVVMENSVIRSTSHNNCTLGNHVMVGPHCHLSGCVIGDEVFVATGVSVFNGAQIGAGAELRINAVVHIKTHVAAGATVPIGWVAVGNPAQLFSADQHDAIWAVQQPLDFPGYVFGVDRNSDGVMRQITERYGAFLARQRTAE